MGRDVLRENLRALFAEYKNLSVVEQMEWDGEWVPRATLEKMGMKTRPGVKGCDPC
jgi:hypothetical protein